MIRKNEKVTANEVINAFNTGRSFPSKHSTGAPVKIVDKIPHLRVSRMRINSGDTIARAHRQENVIFNVDGGEIQGETPSLSPNKHHLNDPNGNTT